MIDSALLNELLHSPLADRLVLTLAHFLWQGSVVAVVVLSAGAMMGGNARRRYAVSTCGLFALAVCPLATFTCLDNGRVLNNETFHAAEHSTDLGALAHDGLPRLSGETTVAEFDGLGSPSYKDEMLTAASPWVLAFWLLGVGVFSCRLLLGFASIAWLKHTGEEAGEMLLTQARKLSFRLNVTAPAIRVSRRVSQAIAVGFFRPVIVIPTAWLIQLPPECLEAVLAHELAHIRRRDLWINLLQRIVETLLFFHPAVWWLSGRLRQEREMCCDELAVSLTGRRVEYASTLEIVARRRSASGAPALAAGMGGRKMALLNRVRNILGLSPASSGVGPWTLGAAALVAAAAVWWVATGGTPLALFAGEEDDFTLVAFQDDEEGEREERGDRERDDDREEGERERPRDRDREEGEREERRERDGDREEGERERDRPSPEQFRRQIELLKRRVHALAEEGRGEEAERLEREIHQAVQRFEREHSREGGDRFEVHPEIRAHLEQLHRRLREAAEAGRGDEAEELERAIHAIHQRLAAQREGRGDRPRAEGERRDVPQEVRRHLEELHHALRNAQEEGREDAAHRLENEIREVHARLREHHGEGERDRPRPDVSPRDRELIQAINQLREEVGRLRHEVEVLKGARGQREGDRPRIERDRPREGDARRESDRPDRPRERDGEGREE